MLESTQPFPKMPFILMNRHHVLRFQPWCFGVFLSGYGRYIGERAFHRGKIKEGAVAIDVDCKRYPLLDIINLGRSWNPLNQFAVDRLIKVKYIFGEPTQLTFDEARHEIVELICSRKWYGQTGGTEKNFRAQRAQAKDMKEFLVGRYGIAFYGRWMMHYEPPKRRPRRKPPPE